MSENNPKWPYRNELKQNKCIFILLNKSPYIIIQNNGIKSKKYWIIIRNKKIESWSNFYSIKLLRKYLLILVICNLL